MFCILAAVIVFSGCGHKPAHYDVRQDLSVYFNNADEVIQTIREAFRARSAGITITYRSHGDNMSDISALTDELVTYAMSETDDPHEGDYLYQQYGGYTVRYSYDMDADGYSYTIEIVPEYYTTEEQECRVDEITADIISSIISDDMTDAGKAEAVYNYICDNVKYDLVHKNNPYYHLRSTAYGALVNGCATCQGCSVLMYRLFREAGLDSRIITGNAVRESGTEYHAWNIVRIGDKYYNADVTWDLQTDSDSRSVFLRGEEGFSEKHIRDEKYSTSDFYEKYPMSETDFPT